MREGKNFNTHFWAAYAPIGNFEAKLEGQCHFSRMRRARGHSVNMTGLARESRSINTRVWGSGLA
jgi:hypothetical protein